MSKYIKSFNDATSMRAYLDTAEGMKYYLLKNEAGEDGIGATPESGKKIVSLFKGRDYLTFTAQQSNSTVNFNNNGWTSVESSIDGGTTWVNAQNVTITLANVGDSVKYRGVLATGNDNNKFSMSGKIAASGSIMSMYDNDPNDTVISINKCFKQMFKGCSSLTQSPELPATTLTDSCYMGIFSNCSSLTQSPELPATTLVNSCYSYMFENCSSLTQSPELPATTLVNSCYSAMFIGCTSLNYVKHHITSWTTYNTEIWLNNVAATGILECPVGCTIPSNSTSGVPTGWTKVEF